MRASSRFAQNTDTNNNTEVVDQNQGIRPVSAADRAARRAKRAQRLALQTDSNNLPTDIVAEETSPAPSEKTDSPFVIKVSNITVSDKKVEENIEGKFEKRPGPAKNSIVSNAINNIGTGIERKKSEGRITPGVGVRSRINTWSESQTTTPKYGGGKFQFGTDYNTKKTSVPAREPPSVGRIATNKYTPTLNKRTSGQRPYSTGFIPTSKFGGGSSNPGRFQGIQKDEPEKPSFAGSAADRMAQFRESMEKEKAQKEREEERKRLAEEKKKEAEERRKEEEEKRKQEELEKKKEDEKKALEAKAKEEEADAIPDSEKIKHIPACQKRKEKKPARRTMSISNIVMDWVQEMTKDYPVEIKNFSASWNDGMAFCALIHKFNPDEFDFSELKPENKRYNFDLAFNTGAKVKNIPILLDTEDMVRMKKPEPRSVQCYIQWIWSVYGPTSGYGPTPAEVQNATIA